MNSSTLIIRNLELMMFIGVLDREKKAKQRVIVSAEILLKSTPDVYNDDIDDVLSYNDIIQAIKDLAKDRHIHLVETFAEDIADAILKHNHAAQCKVHVEKPDIYDDADSVGIEIIRS